MTHLKIEQNNSAIEQVSSAVITKLYELATSGELDLSSNLVGRLHTTATYKYYIEYLCEDLNKGGLFENLHITADQYFVYFADSNVNALMTRYIGDSNGVTEDDISRAVFIELVFGVPYTNSHTNTNNYFFASDTERASIVTFNEFEQFPYVSNITSSFKDCTNLESIRLPLLITRLDNDCFRNCPKLSSINLSNITYLGSGVFNGCTLLNNISTPNITYVGNLCFNNCTSLSSIDLTNVTTIENSGFNNCTSLQTVTSILNLTYIGDDAFNGCSRVAELLTINLPNLTFLGNTHDGVFKNCVQIEHVTNLGTITTIGDRWNATFLNCSHLEDATLPETVTTINHLLFNGCTSLRYVKILSNSVPTYSTTDGWGSTSLAGTAFGEKWNDYNNPTTYSGQTYPIYVKDELLSQYQSATTWQYVGLNANRLKPLSQFASDFPNG